MPHNPRQLQSFLTVDVRPQWMPLNEFLKGFLNVRTTLKNTAMNASDFKITIIDLVIAGKYKISEHALDALLDDELARAYVSDSIAESEILENYPDFGKGPAILLYQIAADGRVVHCVWGIPKEATRPAVLITAYIPDASK